MLIKLHVYLIDDIKLREVFINQKKGIYFTQQISVFHTQVSNFTTTKKSKVNFTLLTYILG